MAKASEQTENIGAKVVPLYAARIEDLGPGDFVKVDCAACSRTALPRQHSYCGLALAHGARCSISWIAER
jgi:hypothetical protein